MTGSGTSTSRRVFFAKIQSFKQKKPPRSRYKILGPCKKKPPVREKSVATRSVQVGVGGGWGAAGALGRRRPAGWAA